MNDERATVRDLAQRYLEIAETPENDRKRELWRRLHDLDSVRPMIHFRGGRLWDEIPEVQVRHCTDPFLRDVEGVIRQKLYAASLGDDTVFEPWLTCRASFSHHGWGISADRKLTSHEKGAFKEDYPLKDITDLSQLVPPHHVVDEAKTAQRYDAFQDLLGDILPVDLNRSPVYTVWSGDIATDLGHLRGIQEAMMDMYDEPDALHALLAFFRDGILRVHEEAEASGDWGLSSHENQSMTYGAGLTDPAPNKRGVKQKKLWGYMAAQEMTLISPAMHDEFMLRYQLPIMERFGVTSYGCCEDLTGKIDILRKVSNLRRIAVAPLADIEKCAEQIDGKYVISYRPNPAQMVCVGYDEDLIRKIVGHALEVTKGQHIEINLKDVQTVQHEPERLNRWVKVVRELIEEKAC